ncbi:hypothetical protein NDU88_001584 [Pleurodeles waltl]|uniref:Uncharacterized protein n=1 Tax=Pleurodeles waltl TaxID=8319 RepID=A0AAV7MLC0_PLEWA|nr:hypothetical protein NDU88_001584 [Pleurodeles waltl]
MRRRPGRGWSSMIRSLVRPTGIDVVKPRTELVHGGGGMQEQFAPRLWWGPTAYLHSCFLALISPRACTGSTALPAGSSSRCFQFPDSTATLGLRVFVFSPAAATNAVADILFLKVFPGTPITLAQRCFCGGRIARNRVAPDAGGPQGMVPAGRKRSGALCVEILPAGPRSRPGAPRYACSLIG